MGSSELSSLRGKNRITQAHRYKLRLRPQKNTQEDIRRRHEIHKPAGARDQDPKFSSPPQHHPSLLLLRRLRPRLPHDVVLQRRQPICQLEEIGPIPRAQGQAISQADLPRCVVHARPRYYPQRYQTLEHTAASSNVFATQDMVKICDFGWSINSPLLR